MRLVFTRPRSGRIGAPRESNKRMISSLMTKVPTLDQLMNPLIAALRDLGGSGSIEEIYEKVIENLKLSDDVLSVLHEPEVSNQTEVHYRLAWARTYLKKYGALMNSSRGVWSLAKTDLAVVDT